MICYTFHIIFSTLVTSLYSIIFATYFWQTSNISYKIYCIIGWWYTIFIYPFILLKIVDTRSSKNSTRSLNAQAPYTGIKNVLATVYKEGGVRGLYRGVGIYYILYLLYFLDGQLLLVFDSMNYLYFICSASFYSTYFPVNLK